jgi:hypothetical protein
MLMRLDGVLAAFVVALAVMAAQMAMKRADVLQPDERTYLAVVNDLVRTGVYTDGTMTASGQAGLPGRFIAPAYPALIAGLARMDAGLARTLICLDKDARTLRNACGSLATVYAVQVVLAAIGAAAIFAIGLRLAGSTLVAWGTLGLVLATGELATYARLLLTDTLAFVLFLLFVAVLVELVTTGRTVMAAAAGAALGLAALARPSYVYLLYATVAALMLGGALRRRLCLALRPAHGIVLLGAGFAVMAPWMVRNWLQFGDTALTGGYGAFTLAQRVAYNAMTWAEWGAAWVYWFPDVGDSLARAMFGKEQVARLGWNDPQTFYQVGLSRTMVETEAAAGGADRQLGYLIRHHVLGDLAKHVAVTLTLAWRGMWAGKWLGVAALVLAWPVVAALVRQRRSPALLALTLPLFFMLGLNAFVSVSIVRYNVPMIALYGFIVAFAAAQLWQRWYVATAGARP